MTFSCAFALECGERVSRHEERHLLVRAVFSQLSPFVKRKLLKKEKFCM